MKDNKFRCTTLFSVEIYKNMNYSRETFNINPSSIWVKDESNYRIIEGEIRLENKDGRWIEIDNKTFKDYFEQI